MIPDPRWCDANPAACTASVRAYQNDVRTVGMAGVAGAAAGVLLLLAVDAARRGEYRRAAGCALAAVTVAAVTLLLL